MWHSMNCFRDNMSTSSTRTINVSMKFDFMDMFPERVHAVDMNGHNHAVTNQYASFAANMRELEYGG